LSGGEVATRVKLAGRWREKEKWRERGRREHLERRALNDEELIDD